MPVPKQTMSAGHNPDGPEDPERPDLPAPLTEFLSWMRGRLAFAGQGLLLFGLALAGFALLGAGLSVVVPLVFSAAAATGRPGPNLALVTSSGYLGLLAGPALIGGVAQLVGLHAALGIVVVLCVMCAVLAGFVLPRSARDEF